MRKREKALEHLLKKEHRITIDKLVKIIGSEEGNTIINELFLFFSQKLDNYLGEEKLDYLVRGINLIPILLENFPNIKIKSLKKRYRKLYEKVDQIKEENVPKCLDPSNAIHELKKIKKVIMEQEKKPYRTENKHYRFLELIIYDLKNIEYLEETLECIPEIVNIKNKDDYSIYSKVLEKFLDNLEKDSMTEDEASYYDHVLSIISKQPNFKLSAKDKRFCFSKLKKAIQELSNSGNYSELVKIVTGIRNTLLYEEEEVPLEQLLEEYHININFSHKSLEELKKFQKRAKRKEAKNRIKLEEYIITIDGPNAVEIDDGLSIRKLENGNYLVGVHIANVLGYLPYQSLPVQEAIFKGNSIYEVDIASKETNQFNNVIPIFPFDFSANTASLLEKKPRFAISHMYEIDQEGEIVDYVYQKTLIRSSKKCTYQEIDKILEEGSFDERLNQTVHLLDELTYKLVKKDKARKIYLDIKNQEVDLSNLKVDNTNPSERIVNQLMKLTNSNKADFFAHLDYPFLYRVHKVKNKDTAKLEEALKTLSLTGKKEKFDQLYKSLLSIYPRAYYDLSGSHEGLNIKHYCHGTSPLRRGADNLVELALDICYFQNPTDRMLYELENEIRVKKEIINTQNEKNDAFLTRYYAEKEKVKKR